MASSAHRTQFSLMVSFAKAASRIDVSTLGLEPGRPIQRCLRLIDPHFHIDDLAAHQLELADGLAELLPVFRVADRHVEQSLHRSDGVGKDASSFPVHGMREKTLAASLSPKAVLHRDLAIVEEQFSHRRCAKAHFLERASDLKARVVFLDEKAADAIRPGRPVEGGVHDDKVRDIAVGDEGFAAIQHIPVAAPFRRSSGGCTRLIPSRAPLIAFPPIKVPLQRSGRYLRFCYSDPKSSSGTSTVHIWALIENTKPLSLHAYPRFSRTPTVVSGSAPIPP